MGLLMLSLKLQRFQHLDDCLIKAFATAATCYVKEIAKVFSKFRDPQMVNNNVDK